MKMNWEPQVVFTEEGVYRMTVAYCEEKQSERSGEYMFEVEFTADDFDNARICRDFIMTSGKGLGIGQAKLSALGFGDTDEWIDPMQIMGRKVGVCLKWSEWTKDGSTMRTLKPDISVGNCGYIKPEHLENYKILVPDPNADTEQDSLDVPF